MDKYHHIFIILTLNSLLIFSLSYNAFGQEVNPPQELTGSHKILSCDMCHGDGVWHTAQKDVTVCKRCHGDQWEVLTEKSMHRILMTEGTIQSGDNEVKVSYCTTCHSPHNNDYLRITNSNGTAKHYFFNNSLQICINCHFTDGEASNIKLMSNINDNNNELPIISENSPHQNRETIKILTEIDNDPKNELIRVKDSSINQITLPLIGQYSTLIVGFVSMISIMMTLALLHFKRII